jgi:hypothetical protein
MHARIKPLLPDLSHLVAELSRGYTWGDEVLRPVRARVAQYRKRQSMTEEGWQCSGCSFLNRRLILFEQTAQVAALRFINY